MLTLRQKGFFSGEYIAEEHGSVVAHLHRSTWHDKGEIKVEGRTLRLARHGVLKDTFVLTEGSTVIAEVSQANLVSGLFRFQFDDAEFEIRDKSWYSSTRLVTSLGSTVGRIRQRHIFSGDALVELPESLPLELRVFVGWMAMVQWDTAGAIAGAAS